MFNNKKIEELQKGLMKLSHELGISFSLSPYSNKIEIGKYLIIEGADPRKRPPTSEAVTDKINTSVSLMLKASTKLHDRIDEQDKIIQMLLAHLGLTVFKGQEIRKINR